jgi:hypothetical protein
MQKCRRKFSQPAIGLAYRVQKCRRNVMKEMATVQWNASWSRDTKLALHKIYIKGRKNKAEGRLVEQRRQKGGRLSYPVIPGLTFRQRQAKLPAYSSIA